jgi:hypothetical protein
MRRVETDRFTMVGDDAVEIPSILSTVMRSHRSRTYVPGASSGIGYPVLVAAMAGGAT